jgi:hypothetical protein
MNEHTNQPTYRAFTIVKREEQNDFWTPIGAAFPHKDGNGFNIMLAALPISGKIVLRPTKEKQSAEPPE